jgi:hypothetical protein
VTVATEAKTRMVSSLKTEANGTTAVMKMITSVSLLVMQMGTTHAMRMALTRVITVVLAATKAMGVGLAASISLLVRILPLLVFVLHPPPCQH